MAAAWGGRRVRADPSRGCMTWEPGGHEGRPWVQEVLLRMDHGGSYAVSGMRGSTALCLAQRGAPMTVNVGRHGGDHAGHGEQHLS
jgi:hypothetical protein